MIARITKAYTRTYSDNGHTTTYVEWSTHTGVVRRTEGPASNPHMAALLARAEWEGIPHTQETW